MNELDILTNYLLENNFTSTYEDALYLVSVMSENWASLIIDNYLEENYLFNYIMEMRKEDKVRGKKKTPLHVTVTRKSIQKTSEGSPTKWRVHKVEKQHMNPEVSIARTKQGLPTYSTSVGKYGARGELSGYGPHPHGTGGRLRGVRRKPGDKTPPDWGSPQHNLNQSKAYRIYNNRKARREAEQYRADRNAKFGTSKWF